MNWMAEAKEALSDKREAAEKAFGDLAESIAAGTDESSETVASVLQMANKTPDELSQAVAILNHKADVQKGREELAGAVKQLETVSQRLTALKKDHDEVADRVGRTIHELEQERSKARNVVKRVEGLLADD